MHTVPWCASRWPTESLLTRCLTRVNESPSGRTTCHLIDTRSWAPEQEAFLRGLSEDVPTHMRSSHEALEDLRRTAQAVLGEVNARLALGSLGTDAAFPAGAGAISCECQFISDYCIGSQCRNNVSCTYSSWGCGTFGTYPCNGLCLRDVEL